MHSRLFTMFSVTNCSGDCGVSLKNTFRESAVNCGTTHKLSRHLDTRCNLEHNTVCSLDFRVLACCITAFHMSGDRVFSLAPGSLGQRHPEIRGLRNVICKKLLSTSIPFLFDSMDGYVTFDNTMMRQCSVLEQAS